MVHVIRTLVALHRPSMLHARLRVRFQKRRASSSDSDAISDAEFRVAMEACGVKSAPLVVGVSGGPDSTALLLLLKSWFDDQRQRRLWLGPPTVHAVTVDHALRSEAADEARAVGQLCSVLGVSHTIVRLDWASELPSKSQISRIARDRRYDALATACATHNSSAILIAHTLQDQVETVLLRWARASSLRGLAGMHSAAPIPSGQGADGIAVYRPLLSWPKKRLIATCVARGATFAVDPSNFDLRYDRVRIRSAEAELSRSIVAISGASTSEANGQTATATTEQSEAILRLAVTHLQQLASDLDSRGEKRAHLLNS